MAVKVLAHQLDGLDKSLNDLRGEIASAQAQCEKNRLLDEIPGVGKLIATAVVANVPDPGVFKLGRDFAACLGITPRQSPSVRLPTLGAITKQGN
ncbi:transposase [Rhodoblastus acidophilus]|uniref:Transposase n=1 Tax=Candidatus Rhodoblastus alkanivorans TaxID=2954117 RepID=A0ABS9ZBA8_9HYPH|nr:transposase [Candidatus Rhodoblastus alkanivorans]MCI4684999.1 transposase [Candidatus Rhodoblastus alkanivorans]